jgi:hypothetical protein
MQETQRFFSRNSRRKSWCMLWGERVRGKRQQWWQRILRIIKQALFLLDFIAKIYMFTAVLRFWLIILEMAENKVQLFCVKKLLIFMLDH